MKYHIEELKRLLKKELEGTLTAEEALFLESLRPLFGEEEWNEWRIDAALELPEPDDPTQRAGMERMLDQAENEIAAAGGDRQSPSVPATLKTRRWWKTTFRVAACVAVFVLWQLWYIYHPHFVLDEAQRCSDVSPTAELRLSSAPVLVSYGKDADPQTELRELPGDSLQVGAILVRLVDEGSYAVTIRDTAVASVDPAAATGSAVTVSFHTGAYQHIQVSLPDGTVVRLDAGSRLDYHLENPDSRDASGRREWIGLYGQALVRIPERDDPSALLVRTLHGWLKGHPGEFVLRVTPDEVRATLLSGSVLLHAHTDPGHRVLAEAGTQVRLCKVCNEQRQVEDQWSVNKLNKAGIAQSLTWTKAVRHYRNVPMRDFVSDMARWYGIRFEDINCISASTKVNVEMCYRADPAELIDFIRNSGTTVIEHKYYYSFCDTAPNGGHDIH